METIAAIATPHAAGGISVIRISGDQAFAVADRIFHSDFGKIPSKMAGYTCAYGTLANLDDGILTAQTSDTQQDRGSALAEFKNFGLVAGEVGEEIPFEILVVDQLGVQAQLDTAVAHFADILPCLVESDDVNNGSLKQQVPGNLVIEVCREFQPVVP